MAMAGESYYFQPRVTNTTGSETSDNGGLLYSSLPLYSESSLQQYVNLRAWLCANKTLLTKIKIKAVGCSL